MFPCTTPSLCGVTNHRDGTVCQGQQRINAKHSGAPTNSPSLISPQSASGRSNVTTSLTPDEFERRSELLVDYLDGHEGEQTVPYAYNPEEMSTAYLVTDPSDDLWPPASKGQYVIEGLEGDNGDDDHPDGDLTNASTDVEDDRPKPEDGWILY